MAGSERRQEVRVPINKEIEVKELILNDQFVSLPRPLKIFLKNMSCSGILMTTVLDIPTGTCFFIKLPVGDEEVAVIIEILRHQRRYADGVFEYGCRFLQIPDPCRAKIRKYIFDEQLRSRRKK